MASPWSYAYDNANCSSGIFYLNDPREKPVHKRDQVNPRGPALNNPWPSPSIGATTAVCRLVQPRPNGTHLSLPTQPQPERIYLPALRVSAKVSVKAMVAETMITQSFQNLKDTPIEHASYSFPLYQGSVIHGFKCFIGKHRMIEGVVEPKEKAKAEFEKAVARQRVAAMLEEHTPEIFETHIGSIPANEVIRVEVSYISELKVDVLSKDVVFILPMSIASRYGIPPGGYSEGNSTIEEQGLEISVDVSLPVPITSLASRSHPISVTIGSTAPTSFKDINPETDLRKGNATLSNRAAKLESDFILLISPKESISNTRAFMEPHPEYNNHSAIMVTISPQDFAKNSTSTDYSNSEILFVIDCSGSMADKVNDLRIAMKVAIRSLPAGCAFNMCFFGSSHELLWEASKPATQQNTDEAFARAAHLSADMGGTELNSALKHVIASRTPNMETNVVVVTDGETWDAEEIHASVRETNKEQGVRFFCLGIGNEVSHALVEGIGRQGCGLSEVVAVAEPGKWEGRVIRLLKGALTPTSWHITLHPGSFIADSGNLYSTLGQEIPIISNLRAPSLIQASFQIPRLHTFSRPSVFLLVNHSTFGETRRNIHMTAKSLSGQTVDLVVEVERLESTPSVVHVLATHAVVKDLENQTSWLHGMKHEGHGEAADAKFEEIVKKEAEEMGRTWSITGKWTSFIAVERSGPNAHVKNLVRLYRAEASQLSHYPMRGNSTARKMIFWDDDPPEPPGVRSRKFPVSLSGPVSWSNYNIEHPPPWDEPIAQPAQVSKDKPRKRIRFRPDVAQKMAQMFSHSSCVPRQDLKPRITDSMQFSTPHQPVYEPEENLQASSISVGDIISAQLSTGCFDLHSTLLKALLSAFDEKTVQRMESKLAIQYTRTEEPLFPTIIAIVYLEIQFSGQLELLELVIDKARGWLESIIPGEKDELLDVARGGWCRGRKRKLEQVAEA